MWNGPWPLVSREAELESFARGWESRRVSVVLIAGAAGVGKSRLAEACFDRVTGRQGVRGARVAATTVAATVPLGALMHLIPAEIDLSDPVAGFASVARSLAGPSRSDRLVVLVDDLPLLDAASRLLLTQLLRAGNVRLIATARTGAGPGMDGEGADHDSIDSLAPVDSTHRIDLAPLRPEQVEGLLRTVLGGQVSRRASHMLATTSGGNVLYLRELVDGALRSGSLTDNGEIWGLAAGRVSSTPRLGELINSRLRSAPEAAKELLELLALCESLPLADAVTVATMPVMITLEETGLIMVQQDRRRTTVTLAHPLYAEVLRTRLPALRRRMLLLSQVDRVTAHGLRRHDDALRVATWLLAATGRADADLLVRAALLARHAHDYRQAATLLEAVTEDRRSFAVHLWHGEALLQLGEWRSADVSLAEAERTAPGEGERVAATMMRTTNLFWMVDRELALQVNQAAIDRGPGPDNAAALEINDAAMRTISGEPVRGLAVLDGLAADIDKAPNVSMWSIGAMSETMGLALVGRSVEAASLAATVYARHLQIEQESLDVQFLGPPASAQLNSLIVALSEAGRLGEARHISDQVLADTAETQQLHTWIWAAYFRGRVEWLAGDAATARHWYAEAITHGRVHNDLQVLHLALGGLATSAALLGDAEAAEVALASRAEIPAMGLAAGEEGLGHAWLCAARGSIREARTVLARAVERAAATGHATSEMLLLTDLARLGDPSGVIDRLTELAAFCQGEFASARLAFVSAMTTETASAALEASEGFSRVGAHLLAAEAAAFAAGLLRRSREIRRATAAEQRARAALAHCPGVRTPLLTQITGALLTPREREIALLAAQGRSDKDIAAELKVSGRTVEHHLQAAYGKLGIASRRDLASTLELPISAF